MSYLRAFWLIAAVTLTVLLPRPAVAQDGAFIQIEAERTLARATDRARQYAAALPDVNGFYLGSGWYGIALGPYEAAEARAILRSLRVSGAIPSDSYVTDGGAYQQQFWPIGAQAAAPAEDDSPAPEPVSVDPTLPEETVSEARASERAMSAADKRKLQVALQWAGFYNGAIDGLYGRGTRNAMAAWQAAQGFQATGVMTTAQRVALIEAYDAILDGLGMEIVTDERAGIEIMMPTALLGAPEYQSPFARYPAASDAGPARVILISQPGDAARFAGFYEILQTLEIMPLEGPRDRSRTRFEMEGTDDAIHSYATASLDGGEIKGFVLVWPTGDEDRRARVLQEMQASFRKIPGLLDPDTAAAGTEQSVDLVAGLRVRTPDLVRSGFYIGGDGTVLTVAEAVEGCQRITLNAEHEAELVHLDAALGIAALRPVTALAPIDVAVFQTAPPRLRSNVAVAGFPFGGILSAPTLTFGTLADIRGLNGEEELKRLALAASEGDVGGPILDDGGAVLGLLLPRTAGTGQVLPADVSFAADAGAIVASLSAAGIAVEETAERVSMPPETMTRKAADMTVLVSCW